MYIWEAVGKAAAAVLGGSPAPVKAGGLSLTGGEIRSLYDVISHLVRGTANVADEEVVADVVIDLALASAGPVVASLAAPAAEALAAYIIEGIASGRIKGGDPGEGQTKPPAHGWTGR